MAIPLAVEHIVAVALGSNVAGQFQAGIVAEVGFLAVEHIGVLAVALDPGEQILADIGADVHLLGGFHVEGHNLVAVGA